MGIQMSKSKITQGEKSSEKGIKITVKFLSAWPSIIGNNKTINLYIENNTSVLDLLNFLNKKYGDAFSQIRDMIVVLINDQHINALNGLNTILKENDNVLMFLIFGGG